MSILSAPGAEAGLAFYLAVGFIMNQAGLLADFKVTYGTLGLGLAIAVAVGMMSAALPALRASRMGIADAWRYLG